LFLRLDVIEEDFATDVDELQRELLLPCVLYLPAFFDLEVEEVGHELPGNSRHIWSTFYNINNVIVLFPAKLIMGPEREHSLVNLVLTHTDDVLD